MAKKQPVSLVLAGIGGMGACYIDELFHRGAGRSFKLVGAVEPSPRLSRHRAQLEELKVPIFTTFEEFYARERAELAIVSSPIPFHADQTCLALAQGSHVLCEKPAAAVIQDARRMSRASQDAGRFVAVGYQMSFSRAIQHLKKDILAGVYGRPRRLRCLYLWPRDETYYGRNSWAGRVKDDAGRWVLDSPANNAMAHDLHNMLYLLGDAPDRSAQPARVMAELYRAYPIQNYDTVAARIITREGVELLAFFSHAGAADIGPVASFEFEEGTILASGRSSALKGIRGDGSLIEYGLPGEHPFRKLWDSLDAARTGRPPVCGIEAALSQTLTINGFQESSEVAEFPGRMKDWDGEPGSRSVYVRGLEETFVRCYERGALPSEMGVDWAHRPGEVSLDDYPAFPSAKR